MALPVFITLTTIISLIFFFLNKKLLFLQNSILFMIMAILTRNYITIMTMQLKLIKTTEDPFLFPAVLMYREVIIPLIVLIFINIYLLSSCWKKKVFLLIGVLASMLGINYLTVFFRLVVYIKWNFIYALIVEVAYLFIGLGIAKIVMFLQEWESRQSDSCLRKVI